MDVSFWENVLFDNKDLYREHGKLEKEKIIGKAPGATTDAHLVQCVWNEPT